MRQQRQQRRPALDRIIDAALSERGQSLVAVAVSLGARNLISSFLETRHALAARDGGAPDPAPRGDLTDRLLAFLGQPGGQQLVALATGAFVSHGMRVYMDESMEVNVYEDLFASMAKPDHLEAVAACVGTFAREAVAAAVTSGSGGGSAAGTCPAQQQQQQQQQRSPPGLIVELVANEGGPPDAAGSSAAAAHHTGAGEDAQSVASSAAVAPERVGDWVLSRHDDLDSDSLLHASQGLRERRKAGSPLPANGAGSGEGLAVGTPLGADSPSKPAHPAAMAAAAAARRLQQPPAAAGVGGTWVAAVVREWFNAARDPTGREVMLQLAGTFAKEAAAGASSALVQSLDASWLVLAAFAALLLCWLALQLAALLLR